MFYSTTVCCCMVFTTMLSIYLTLNIFFLRTSQAIDMIKCYVKKITFILIIFWFLRCRSVSSHTASGWVVNSGWAWTKALLLLYLSCMASLSYTWLPCWATPGGYFTPLLSYRENFMLVYWRELLIPSDYVKKQVTSVVPQVLEDVFHSIIWRSSKKFAIKRAYLKT